MQRARKITNQISRETYVLFTLFSAPFILSICSDVIGIIPAIFAGHSINGLSGLAAIALSQTFINLTGLIPFCTLSSAIDSLIIYIADEDRNRYLGILLQRSVLLHLFLSIPVAVVWINAGNILALLYQPPELVYLCDQYIVRYIAVLPAYAVSISFIKILQIKSCVWPSAIIFCISVLLEIAASIAIFVLDLDIVWYSLPPIVAFYTIAVCHCVYFAFSRVKKSIWSGFNCEAWEKWFQFCYHGSPMLFIQFFETFPLYVGGLLLGIISQQPILDIAVHYTMTYVNSLLYIPCISFSIALALRINTLVGQNLAKHTRLPILLTVSFLLTLVFLQSIFLLSTRKYLGFAFSNYASYVSEYGSLVFLFTIFHPFNCLVSVLQAVLRGFGNKKFGILILLLSVIFFLISLPTSFTLAIILRPLSTLGYWIGISIGYVGKVFLCFILISYCLAREHLNPFKNNPFNRRFKGNCDEFTLSSIQINSRNKLPCYTSTIQNMTRLKWKIALRKCIVIFIFMFFFLSMLSCKMSCFKATFHTSSYLQSPIDFCCFRFVPNNCTYCTEDYTNKSTNFLFCY